MLVIASSSYINEKLKLSYDSTSPVPRDSFYLELNCAKIDYADTSVPCYVILPHELVSIIDNSSIILIQGYVLEQQPSDHGRYRLFKAVQGKLGNNTLSVITDNEILLNFEHEHTLEVDIAEGWKLSWTKGQPPVLKDAKRKLVYGKDISAEYEGTPAECYRCTIPYTEHQLMHSCFRYEE